MVSEPDVTVMRLSFYNILFYVRGAMPNVPKSDTGITAQFYGIMWDSNPGRSIIRSTASNRIRLLANSVHCFFYITFPNFLLMPNIIAL